MTNEQPKFIDLSKASIEAMINLCDLIANKYSDNEMSVNMSNGISHWLSMNTRVTYRQAVWLARNFDYQRIERPDELKGIEVPAKKEAQAPISSPSSDDEIDKLIEQLTSCVAKLEKLIEAYR